MRALAEFIMRGRLQALMVSVISIGTLFFAWLGVAVVALVTLRKGPAEGGYILAWALLPALALAMIGQDVGPLAALLGATAAAVVLRQTVSLPLALMVAAISGLLTAAAMSTVGSEQLEAIRALLQEFTQQLRSQAANGEQVEVMNPSPTDIAGMIGMSNTATVVACLLLARWWQGMLYNPGGFREEFHSLRLSPVAAVVLVGAMVLVLSAGEAFRLWPWIFMVPLTVAGFGLVHGAVAKARLGRHWLVFFYIAWLLIGPVRLALVLMAIADSWIDIRKRISGAQGS